MKRLNVARMRKVNDRGLRERFWRAQQAWVDEQLADPRNVALRKQLAPELAELARAAATLTITND